MVIASLVSRSMLDTLELRERLKEFSRLSVAAAAKHRSAAQVDMMQGERNEAMARESGVREKTGKKGRVTELWKGTAMLLIKEERMVA